MKKGVFTIREAIAKAKGVRTARRLAPVMMGLLLPVIFYSLPPAATARPAQARKQATANEAAYVCVMDPEVRSGKPGKCPKCGMRLRKASDEASAKSAEVADKTISESRANDARAQIPDTTVYDQEGRRLRFYSDLVKGKTVAINFIFTTCTTICPPLTATFRRVQQELGDRVGRDVALISVSVDPTTDVPERLKTFSTKFHAGPGWTFVTGDKQEVTLLLKALGANAGDKTNHSPMVLVGNDRAGYWTRTYGLAPAGTLVQIISDASTKTAAKAAGDQAAAEAKKPHTPADAAAAYFPNTELLTQDNKPVRFFDDLLKG
jgi:cytochrome oxidase Cu insertion factor (SCO1/SenC/PrrC family)